MCSTRLPHKDRVQYLREHGTLVVTYMKEIYMYQNPYHWFDL